MKFVVISKDGDGLGMALRLAREGHDVSLHISNRQLSAMGKGLVRIVETENPLVWRGFVNRPTLKKVVEGTVDCVVVIGTGLGGVGDLLRSQNYRVVGGLLLSDNIEIDSITREAVLHDADGVLKDPPTEYTTRFGAWFNGHSFVDNWYIIRHYRTFMDGDRGSRVECSGVVAKMARGLAHCFTERLANGLKKGGYVGPVFLDVDPSNGKFIPFDISCYMEAGTLSAMVELSKLKVGKFLVGLADGSISSCCFKDGVAISVLISRPPYPYKVVAKDSVNTPLENGAIPHMWLQCAQMVNKDIVVTGKATAIGYVTAYGKSVREARRRTYRTISRVKVPMLQYRHDIGFGMAKEDNYG